MNFSPVLRALALAAIMTLPAFAADEPERVPISTASAERPAQAAAAEALEPADGLKRLTAALAGRWSIRLTFEPRAATASEEVAHGTEAWRPGPGALSLIEEFGATRGDRKITGLGIIWWDAAAPGSRTVWCSSRDRAGCVVFSKVGRWEGEQFALGNEYERAGRKVIYREVFSDFTHDSFTQTISEGKPGGQLQRVLTINARRIASHPDHEGAAAPR